MSSLTDDKRGMYSLIAPNFDIIAKINSVNGLDSVKMKKARADELLSQLPEIASKSQAKLLIMEGKVRIGDRILIKPGDMVPIDSVFTLEKPPKYVGRGGHKLEGALLKFGIDVNGLVAIDVGASTGGFTDCLLQNGAVKVYCVDVGTAQLAPKIANDSRVVIMDNTNARHLVAEMFDSKPQIAVVDCSFISGEKVIEPLDRILVVPKLCVWLLKPQFEAGPGKVGKGGIIRKEEVLWQAVEIGLERVLSLPCRLIDICDSPIKGADGNREFLVYLELGIENDKLIPEALSRLQQQP